MRQSALLCILAVCMIGCGDDSDDTGSSGAGGGAGAGGSSATGGAGGAAGTAGSGGASANSLDGDWEYTGSLTNYASTMTFTGTSYTTDSVLDGTSFSCEGQLLDYDPDAGHVKVSITSGTHDDYCGTGQTWWVTYVIDGNTMKLYSGTQSFPVGAGGQEGLGVDNDDYLTYTQK